MLEGSQLGPAVRAKRTNIESGHYPPTFKLRHAGKDLRLVVEAAAAVDRDLTVSAAARACWTWPSNAGRPTWIIRRWWQQSLERSQSPSSRQLLSALTGQGVQVNKAIVGRNAFAHEAGIHQDGILKESAHLRDHGGRDVGVRGRRWCSGSTRAGTRCTSVLSDLGLSVHASAWSRCIER